MADKPKKKECQICGKVVVRLSDQMKIHCEAKPFKCDFCGKGFKTKGELTVHVRVHTGERPFKCDLCGEGFTLSSALSVHIRTHTGAKPFNCDFCKKGFSRNDTLIRHLQIHTGEKPFKCDLCGVSLKSPQNKLINHLLNQDSFLTNAPRRKGGGKTNSTQKINTFVFYHENAKVSAYA